MTLAWWRRKLGHRDIDAESPVFFPYAYPRGNQEARVFYALRELSAYVRKEYNG